MTQHMAIAKYALLVVLALVTGYIKGDSRAQAQAQAQAQEDNPGVVCEQSDTERTPTMADSVPCAPSVSLPTRLAAWRQLRREMEMVRDEDASACADGRVRPPCIEFVDVAEARVRKSLSTSFCA